MGLRSATLLAIIGTTLALIVNVAVFAEQVLRILPAIGDGMMQYLLTTSAYCLADVLAHGSLLVFLFAVRRSLPPDA